MAKKDKKLKDPEKSKKIRKIFLELLFLIIILFFAIFTDKIPYFQDTEFANIIDKTIGKFFDVSTIFVDNYLKILETITIFVFVWALIKLSDVILKLLSRRKKKKNCKLYFISFHNQVFYHFLWIGIYYECMGS